MSADRLDRKTKTSAVSHRVPTLTHGRLRVLDGPRAGTTVELGDPPLLIGAAENAGLRLEDPKVSRAHCEVSVARVGFRVRDGGSRNGTFFEGSRVQDAIVPVGAIIRVGATHLVMTSGEQSESSATLPGLWGQSREIRRVTAAIERAAKSDATVLLEGETGTGKELAARALHQLAGGAERPFVVFDCGAVNPSLIHSALFGHDEGAFTGAIGARAGAIELARDGTLFIDEVDALPMELQPILLRFLDRGEVQPLGRGHPVQVSTRVVVGTREDLAQRVVAKKFREDLFYRLNVISISLPPLRERLEDLPVLVTGLMKRLGVGSVGPVDGPNLERLRAHGWPGNVRELENTLARALTLGGGPRPFRELTLELSARAKAKGPPGDSFQERKAHVVETFEREFLAELLARSEGQIKVASRISGIERTQLKRLLRKRGLL